MVARFAEVSNALHIWYDAIINQMEMTMNHSEFLQSDELPGCDAYEAELQHAKLAVWLNDIKKLDYD